MSDEGFLKRWSRRKRSEAPVVEREPAAAPPSDFPDGPPNSPSPAERGKAETEGTRPMAAANAKPDDEAIDPATLPPLESLGPDSDYTVFLKKGVPEALRLAALRKAWVSDPFIRDFRSPAIDYGWDFTTPEYSLRAGDGVAKMLDKMFPPMATAAETAAPEAPGPAVAKTVEPPSARPELNLPQNRADTPLPRPGSEPAPQPASHPRQKHGGALPD